jgi:hypothetical protein
MIAQKSEAWRAPLICIYFKVFFRKFSLNEPFFISKFFDSNFFSGVLRSNTPKVMAVSKGGAFGRAPQSAKRSFGASLFGSFSRSFAKQYSSGILSQEKKNKQTQTVSFTEAVSPLFLLTPSAQKRKAGRCLASQTTLGRRP